ncbi:MAG: prolyl oligopeptidase family serine peptidase, partial [Gemmatimonadota bacterium]|nr:prolyl oligopeptidase family serine peptidase [Gemmatimonadota bacterium]
VRNIYVKRLDEPFEAAHPVTADERPVPGYFWSRDGKFILYVQDKGGNENFHIYAVNPAAAPEAATGVPAARDLTPYGAIQARITAVPRTTPNTIVVSLNDRDPQWHDVHTIDLTTGERTLVLENNDRVAGYFADRDGHIRLGVRIKDDGGTEVLRLDGAAFTPVYECSNEESCGPLRVHKDGRRVYMITNKGADVDLSRLALLDPQTKALEVVESDPDGQVDFGGAAFSDVTGDLLATVYVGDRVRIYPKTDEFARDLERIRAALPDGELGVGSQTADERYWIISVSRDVDPGAAYLFDAHTGTATLLYRSRPSLPSEHLAFATPVRYPARDGLSIPAYLTLPRGVEAKNLPTVIVPHGGPWARDSWGYDPYAQFLANRGYAVLQPNFRGSTGYGKQFLNAGNKQWGIGDMQHDISDGVAYLVKQGIADPQKVAIFGGSYGGYATLAGLAFTPELYAAGVSYVGPSNLLTLLASIPPYWAPVRKIFNVRLGNPDDPADLELLKQMSPIHAADQIRVPLLVIQGANDPRVNKAESEQIVVSLRDRGHAVEYILAPDEGHGFAGRENRLAISVAMEKFFGKHLGGRYQEAMPADIAAKLAAITVDPTTVTVTKAPPGGAAMAGAMITAGNGAALAPMTLTYSAMVKTMGQEQQYGSTRTVTAATFDGRPVWRIVEAVQAQGVTAADTVDVDKTTLIPVRRDATGGATVSLRFTDTRVTGKLQIGPQSVPIDLPLEGAVFGEGASRDALLASLPFSETYEGGMQMLALLTQKIRSMKIAVTGSETVTTGAGTFETWVVTLTPLDGDESGTATLHVTRDAPHLVVKGTVRLPAMMGSGTQEVELTGRK